MVFLLWKPILKYIFDLIIIVVELFDIILSSNQLFVRESLVV